MLSIENNFKALKIIIDNLGKVWYSLGMKK